MNRKTRFLIGMFVLLIWSFAGCRSHGDSTVGPRRSPDRPALAPHVETTPQPENLPYAEPVVDASPVLSNPSAVEAADPGPEDVEPDPVESNPTPVDPEMDAASPVAPAEPPVETTTVTAAPRAAVPETEVEAVNLEATLPKNTADVAVPSEPDPVSATVDSELETETAESSAEEAPLAENPEQTPAGSTAAVPPEEGQADEDSGPAETEEDPPAVDPDQDEEVTPAEPSQESAADPNLPAEFARLQRLCTNIFSDYVNESGNVNYPRLRRKRGDLYEVARAFEDFDRAVEMVLTREQRIAFWINAHNIYTLQLIVDNYPIKRLWWATAMYPDAGIMHIPGSRDKNYFKVSRMEYSLREIEKELLLKRFQDARICFALSYATLGGAFLRDEAYTGAQLDEQLDEQVRRFLADPRGLRIDKAGNTVYLSDVFIWYKQLLIEKYGDVKRFRDWPEDIRAYLNFIYPYLTADETQFLESANFEVEFMQYNWKLNDQTSP